MPYLPEPIKRRLLQEHKSLRDFGYPPDAVKAHGEREMELLRQYVPADLMAQLDLAPGWQELALQPAAIIP